MAVYEVLKLGEKLLRENSKEVKKFDDRISRLVKNMIDTMRENDGVGLAAPQIGVLKKVIIIENIDEKNEETGEILSFINPEIIDFEGESIESEGCLSIPEVFKDIKRYTWIKIKAQTILGEEIVFQAEGFIARVIQHEIDHLKGILFIDLAKR